MGYKNFDTVDSSYFPFKLNNLYTYYLANKWAGVNENLGLARFTKYSTISIGGILYDLYNAASTGGTASDLNKGAIKIYQSGDCTLYSTPNAYIKRPLDIDNPITERTQPLFEDKGFIKLQYHDSSYHYYRLYIEKKQEKYDADWSQITNPLQRAFAPYEPITLAKLGSVKATGTPKIRKYSSDSIGAIEYGTPVNFVIGNLQNIPASGYLTNPGTTHNLYFTLWVVGELATVGLTYNFPLSVSNWQSTLYTIQENATSYKVYAGKQVGADFLNHFRFVQVLSNSYKTIQNVIQQSLDKNGLNKRVYAEGNTINFTYTYNGNTASFASSQQVIGLASGNDKFNLITYKGTYLKGETLKISNINLTSGSLLYSDGTSISLNAVDFNSAPSITCSLGTADTYYLDDSISSFDMTYNYPTTYFGNLSFSYTAQVSGQTEDYIVSVRLVNAKQNFTANETLLFFTNASIECLNINDEVVETISFADFSSNITEYPNNYGQNIGREYFVDNAIRLKGIFRDTKEFNWDIYVSYSESALSLDFSQVQRTYYVESEEDLELSLDNLVIKEILHSNTNTGSEIVEIEIDPEDCEISVSPFTLETGRKVVAVNISYTNLYGQVLTGTYAITVIKIEPESLRIVGDTDSTHYWDNNKTKFHYPSGLDIQIRYTDGSIETISPQDYNMFEFYRDENLSVKLTVNQSIIRSSEGSRIYVYYPPTRTSGYYIINFDADTISNVYLDSEVDFTLGNRLNPFRNLFDIKVVYDSGIVEQLTNYTFKNNDYILQSTSIVIIVDETEYTLDSTLITFLTPQINAVSLELNGFKTDYTNMSDGIDCRSIVAKVSYEDAEYVQNCTYDSDSVQDTEHFQISCDNTEMATYVYNGATPVNITMGQDSEVPMTLTFTCKSIFSQETENADLIVKVLDIIDITGISLQNIYSNYHVGDKFLNENDDTTVLIFYKDSSNNAKKFTTKLNSGFAAINILPDKGSTLSRIGTKNVRITAMSNWNVAAEYTINVGVNYIYEDTKEHDLVAVKVDSYTLPNGKTITNHYVLVDRNNTEIASNGARILADNKGIREVETYGYLEDILDDTKNARVILFNDYISPIDGQNNIEVVYPCYVPGNADKINKCRFGILFGNNNAKNRLFVSGNPNEINCDWHSGMASEVSEDMVNGNFGYFEDTSWCYYGETDNKIVGYDIVSNDKLLVLKDHSDKETTIYFRTPTLVSAIDGAGTQMTGINGETLYQEEFSLIKGNNSVAGISPKGIINFNGDTLFLSNDKVLCGLDLVGMIGDNQRYANSRSYYIDEDLKHLDLDGAWLWSDNKYLFLCLKDKVYITHYLTKANNQYEWWVIDIKDVQSIVKIEDKIYFGNSKGNFYMFNDIYEDIDKIFIGAGGGILASEGEQDNKIIVSQDVIKQLDENKTYRFSIVPVDNQDSSYMYYSIGEVSNAKSENFDYYINLTHNALELLCMKNGVIDYGKQAWLTSLIREDEIIYLNHLKNESVISCASGSALGTYYRKYYLKRYIPTDDIYVGGDLYKLYFYDTDEEVQLNELYRAVICYKLDEEYLIHEINKVECSFKLLLEGKELDLVRYADQPYSRTFKAEIKCYTNVKAFYITKPYTLGSLDYFKTIWQYTLTNDTNIPSELELTYASNKIPYEDTMTLNKISVDKYSFSFNDMDFRKIDFDKNIVPRTYTNTRILVNQKFICFGFKNYNNTNSVLSSMSIIYSVPSASYSGD